MAEYKATVIWERGSQLFTDNRYSRVHKWKFDEGVEVEASSSPQVVPVPLSKAAAVDPEEAFIASLSSCHMLWFLAIAGKKGFCVDSYVDEASGVKSKNESGKFFISEVTLQPKIIFSGDKKPTQEEIIAMHDKAHHECYIANSVKSEVHCNPIFVD